MQINLRCSDSLQKVITAVLEANGMQISPDASLMLLEKGFPR
ncbi:MAG: hypothetical protein AB9917_19470 [Negativicutes bacterium]